MYVYASEFNGIFLDQLKCVLAFEVSPHRRFMYFAYIVPRQNLAVRTPHLEDEPANKQKKEADFTG